MNAARPIIGLLLFLCFSFCTAQTGSLYINELMASNHNTMVDATGDAADWIEMFNGGDAPVDLTGMTLSDDVAFPGKHVLSGNEGAFIIPPQGHLLLWASGDTSRGPLHLNFSLARSGETILLYSANGTMVDIVSFPEQYTDVSYGRAGDGAANWVYFPNATPGGANASEGLLGSVAPPTFSVPAGFHSGTIGLSITHPDPAVTIYYTLDGSVPRPEALAGIPYGYKNTYPQIDAPDPGELFFDTARTHVFDQELSLSDPSSQPNFLSWRTTMPTSWYPSPHMPYATTRKAHVVRARAYKEGHLPSPVITSTYLFTLNGNSPYTLPVITLNTERKYLFGFEEGIYNPGIDLETWRIDNLNESVIGNTPANWNRGTELPMSMEWFAAGAAGREFHRDLGFRIHGNYTRLYRRKSMRLYLRERYGQDNLGYALFPEQDDTQFKRLIVHISGNDDRSTNMRDWTLQRVLRHMRMETMDAQPAVLILNGEYWGVHNMRERYDKEYLWRVIGLPEQEIDMVTLNNEAILGDSLHWVQLNELVADEDITDPGVYADVQSRIDIGSHIDQYVAQIYIGNIDWPQNNWRIYRKRTNGLVEDVPHGHDGRWRYLLFDTDLSFRLHSAYSPNFNYLQRALQSSFGADNLLFRRLVQNTEYRNDFINRMADMANTAFKPDIVNGIMIQNRNMINQAMQEHVTRWPDQPGTHSQWLAHTGILSSYANNRLTPMRQQFMAQFGLPAQHDLQVDVSDVAAGWVELNSIELKGTTHGVDEDPYPWSGTYFEGVPVKLVAHALPGWQFSHWEGVTAALDSVLYLDLISDTSVTAVFSPASWCPPGTLHYWHFNNTPNGPLAMVVPDLTTGGNALITYAGEGAGYMDRTSNTDGSTINATPDTGAGRALRVRNPSNDRALIIEAPSTGHRDIVLSYATMRTTNGADSQRVSYSIDPERMEWHLLDSFMVTTQYHLKRFSLEDLVSTDHEPLLAFRVEFIGGGAADPSGNHRFDNIRVSGRPVTTVDATLCEEGTFTHDGMEYPPGTHLHPTGGSDCDEVVLVKVKLQNMDTTVIAQGTTLLSVSQADTYQWLDCADMQPIAGAQQAAFTPAEEGYYAVQLHQAECILVSGCHFAPGDPDIGIVVHPNPMDDAFFIRFITSPKNATYRLSDATGRLLSEGDLRSDVSRISVAHLPQGTYMLEVLSGPAGERERWVRVLLK